MTYNTNNFKVKFLFYNGNEAYSVLDIKALNLAKEYHEKKKHFSISGDDGTGMSFSMRDVSTISWEFDNAS